MLEIEDTGILELDRESIRFTDIMRDLLTLSPNKKELMVSLILCAKKCFAIEEKYMDRCEYPNFDEHKIQHIGYIERLELIKERSGMDLIIGIRKLIFDWVACHLCCEDRDFAFFVKRKN